MSRYRFIRSSRVDASLPPGLPEAWKLELDAGTSGAIGISSGSCVDDTLSTPVASNIPSTPVAGDVSGFPPWSGLCGNVTAMGLCDRAHDRQPEARPA